MNEAMELSARVANRDRVIELVRAVEWDNRDYAPMIAHFLYQVPLDKLLLPGERS